MALNDSDSIASTAILTRSTDEQTATAEGDITQTGNYLVIPGLKQAYIEIVLEPGGSAGSATRGAITEIQIIETLIGDSDGDGLDDTWEIAFKLDPNDDESINPDNGAAGDPDNDGDGRFTKADLLPDLQDVGSVVRPCDINGDGVREIFVGSRVTPQRTSHLHRKPPSLSKG